MTLRDRHALDQRDRPGGVADPPARHRIGFGNAVDRQYPVGEIRRYLRRGDEWIGRITHVFVDIVGQNPDVRMAAQDFEQDFVVSSPVHGARGIARRIQDQPAGPRSDRRLEIGRRKPESSRFGAWHDDRTTAENPYDVEIRHPVWGRDDDLVARIQRRHQCVVDDMLRTAPHGNLVAPEMQPVVAQKLSLDGFLQFARAIESGVLGSALAYRADCGILDRIRGVEVGLAGSENDDVAPSCPQRRRFDTRLQDFRYADGTDQRCRMK